MKGKSQNNEVRKRNKGKQRSEDKREIKKQDDQKTTTSETNDKKTLKDNENSSNGNVANGFIHEKEEVEEIGASDRNENEKEGDKKGTAFVDRLGCLLRDAKIMWLKQIYKTKHENVDIEKEGKVSASRMSYFSKELLITFTLVFCFGIGSRVYDVGTPSHVCWDETHFGKFASYYINGTFFFDVHPPLGKMLLALAGWASGYGGAFPFDKPGDLYGEEKYVGMRMFCALLGGFCVPLAFVIVYELTKSLPASVIAASLILFDHGTLTLSRFILLDSVLMFFMMMSIFSLVKFHGWSEYPFSVDWWGWMFCTGFFLACTFSVKWVGLFVILLAGLLTIKQLWDLLGDLSLPLFVIGQHFMARVVGLIVIPIITYMFFFGVHFQALPLSGPGDGFFSSRFQSTLQGSHLHKATFPKELAYGSIITLKNIKPGGSLLHSHQHLYPKEHPPEQQQITGYSHKDPNNDWMVKKPTNDLFDPTAPLEYVKNGDIVRLEHIMTKRNLHSHNEKAPLTTNLLQVTGYGDQGRGDSNDDWTISAVSNLGSDSRIQAVTTSFRLIHANIGCALGETDKTLPKWGWEQREMACYPAKDKPGTIWNIESHVNDKVPVTSMELMAPSFIEKIYESHIVMAQTNSGFKPKEGEVTSQPWQWPINFRGQIFSGGDHRIYLLGNPVIWWGIIVAFFIFIILYMYHAIREQRGYKDALNTKAKRETVVFSCTFLLTGWTLHYLPFYAMGRVLYFHHYFPAYLFSAMFAGVFLEYFCSSVSSFFKDENRRKKIYFALLALVMATLVISFYAFRGLTYGMSGPMASDQNATQAAYKWLDSWEI